MECPFCGKSPKAFRDKSFACKTKGCILNGLRIPKEARKIWETRGGGVSGEPTYTEWLENVLDRTSYSLTFPGPNFQYFGGRKNHYLLTIRGTFIGEQYSLQVQAKTPPKAFRRMYQKLLQGKRGKLCTTVERRQ